MSDSTRLTESAPMSVDAFLRRLDNWKLATTLIKDDPASALRTIQTIKAERDDLKVECERLETVLNLANDTTARWRRRCDALLALVRRLEAMDMVPFSMIVEVRALLASIDGPVTP